MIIMKIRRRSGYRKTKIKQKNSTTDIISQECKLFSWDRGVYFLFSSFIECVSVSIESWNRNGKLRNLLRIMRTSQTKTQTNRKNGRSMWEFSAITAISLIWHTYFMSAEKTVIEKKVMEFPKKAMKLEQSEKFGAWKWLIAETKKRSSDNVLIGISWIIQ